MARLGSHGRASFSPDPELASVSFLRTLLSVFPATPLDAVSLGAILSAQAGPGGSSSSDSQN